MTILMNSDLTMRCDHPSRELAGSGVYQIRHVGNGKIYAGSAKCFRLRLGLHLRRLRRQEHHSVKLQNAFNKYGAASFEFSILEVVEDLNQLIVREQYWMDLKKAASRAGYNITPTAGSLLGHKMSDSAKAKMSKAHKGLPRSDEHRANLSKVNRGKVMSPESREKMRLAKLGKKRAPHSPETRAKMSAARKGIVFSEETRAKMAKAKLGLKLSDEVRANMSAAQRARLDRQ